MPAPTALVRVPEALSEDVAMPDPMDAEISSPIPTDSLQCTDQININDLSAPETTLHPTPAQQTDAEGAPVFAPEATVDKPFRREMRKIPIPPNRRTPLKTHWLKLLDPLTLHLKLDVSWRPREKAVWLRTNKSTRDSGALQKGEDFVKAFTLGFDVDDAVALVRLDDLYIQTFEIKDVKNLTGEHLSRGIGRIAGKDGKTKFAIENASKTRVVLADHTIHILGGFKNIVSVYQVSLRC